MSSPIGIRSRRMPNEMNRQPLQSPNITSRHVGCQSASNAHSIQFLDVRNSLPICVDHDVFETSVLSDKNVTLEKDSNNVVHLPQNTLPSYSACSSDRCSLSEENDYPRCNCNIMNYQNHNLRAENSARRDFCLSRAFSTTKHYSERIFRSLITRGNNSENRSRWRLIFLFFTVLLTVCTAEHNHCAVGLTTPGWTLPQGDIVLEYGLSLKIFCVLNKMYVDRNHPGISAADIVFFHNKKEMEPEFVTIINETTVSLDVQDVPPSEDMYYCKLKFKNETNTFYESVCLNKVVVGFKPQEPKNFSCISYNWEKLVCLWEPRYNHITTKYTVLFKLAGRSGGRKSYPCPDDTNDQPQPMNGCIWATSTNPIYRQPYEFYTFILNAENILGNATFTYKFNHYAHVIPAKPANLTVISKTSESAMLYWSVPFPMQNFPTGLHHRIMFQSQWDKRDSWQIIDITDNKRLEEREKSFNLTGLRFANAMYDIRVVLKSATSVGEDMWSNFSDITFRTQSKLPGRAPKTDIGSFEVTENNINRDIYLYWQSIPPQEENGENFKYQIMSIEENGRKVTFVPTEITRTYAKFKGISFNNYRFEIATVNNIGISKNRTIISIPSKSEMPPEPIVFTKIAFDQGLYELSWKPPITSRKITNYTIFWCENERDRSYQCTGYLNWVHVSRSTTIYNVTVPEPAKFLYQFAISTNTARGSSGMVWASCTVIHDKVVGKMKTVWINRIGSDFIEVGWNLECSDRIGIVEGFNIYYCPIMSPYNLNCKGPKLKSTIKMDGHTIHGTINNLKPYTTYMLAVAILTKNGEGLHSDPLYNTTLEAAPSTPPQDVKIVNVTNTTMFVTWKPPEAMNGVLRYYEVYYNENMRKVDIEEGSEIELKNLMAHRNYNITIAACTVSCSTKSPTVHEMTQIGVPGKIDMPHVRFVNSSQVIVGWKQPQISAGPLHYYQILTSKGEVQNSTKTVIALSISDCQTEFNHEQRYQFQIRAVNIANNIHLKGPWSEPGEGNCYSDGPSNRAWYSLLAIVLFAIAAVLSGFGYCTRRMWGKCRDMRDVEVKLPPGLAPNMKLLQKIGEPHIRQPSAESSGCSSGQESVTSSLTADSQVSTDSGTDVGPVPVSPDKLLETLPSWESTSLRQRNVTIMRPSITAKTPHWDTYVKVAKSGEPILGETLSLAQSTPNLTDSTGYTTSQHTWSSTGYISMPSSEELSSNPSPVPKENPNTTNNTNVGIETGYSVIGSVPKSIRPKSEDNSMTDTIGDTFICLQPEAKSINPYVTLAALEEKSKEKKKQEKKIHPFTDMFYDDLSFVEPNKCKKDSLDALDTLASRFNSDIDNTSKSYVQTGLIDTPQKSFMLNSIDSTKNNPVTCSSLAWTSLTDSCDKPFMSSFMMDATPSLAVPKNNPSKSESPSATKPYVTVSSIPEIMRSPIRALIDNESLSWKPHVQYDPPSSESSSSKPYVLASSVHRAQQLRSKMEPSTSITEDDDEIDEEDAALYWQKADMDEKETKATEFKLDPDRTIIVSKQNTGYVTIAENPKLEHQRAVTVVGPSPHKRLEKMPTPPPSSPSPPLSPSRTTGAPSTDEQYSKVTVAPSTIQ